MKIRNDEVDLQLGMRITGAILLTFAAVEVTTNLMIN
jgi:hypothetical protein